MRRPQPIPEPQLADLQRRAAVLFVTTLIGQGSRPGTHAGRQLIGGLESTLAFNLLGWRIPTAKFDGTPQDSIRDCVIAPDGEIFPIDQHEAAGDGIARPAHLPVYGLLEGIIELTNATSAPSRWPTNLRHRRRRSVPEGMYSNQQPL